MEDEFRATMLRPVDFAREIGKSRDAEQASMIGRVVIGTGLLFLLFLLVPNTPNHRLMVLALALFVIGIGGLLMRVSVLARREASARPEIPEVG